jgi:predicted Holliday junction resolvase-like endonuclease
MLAMYYILIAFILGALVCAAIMYISSLKQTIRYQTEQIVDLENQLRNLLAERTDRESIH